MDIISNISYYIPLILGQVGELFFLSALFFIHMKFKSIETYIMFYTLLITQIVSFSMQYLMQRPEPVFSKTGEVISVTQPSKIFEYSLYLLPYGSIIVYSALLIFSIKLYKK